MRGGFLSRFRNGTNGKEEASVVAKASPEIRELREKIVIGMPRVLNMYTLSPFFGAYFEALGVNFRNVIYSDYTDPLMWYKGSRRGSIDQCFPSKVAIAHVHNLIYDQKRKPDIIFFPIIQKLRTELVNSVDSTACPTVSITPEVVKAAFTKEGDIFAEHSMQYLAPSLDMSMWDLFKIEMHDCFREVLGVTEQENEEAIDTAYNVWRRYFEVSLRAEARKVLDNLVEEGKVGVVMLGRPYHNDPGLNHEIMAEIQKRGYAIFSVDSLPQDDDILEELFGEEVRAGVVTHPMDITDVWKNNYSENSSKKVWGAKYVARHPNLVAIDLSSFKCGHDAPIYNTVEHIIEATGTPFFTFHDIDESKPTGSIKIRVETIDYFLQRYQEHLKRTKTSEGELEQMVGAYRAHLERASANAATKLDSASRIEISGNDSRPADGHREHPVDQSGAPHHGHDAWVPITFDMGEKASNGGGNGHKESLANALDAAEKHPSNHAPLDEVPVPLNGNSGVEGSGTYDALRAQNTANDAPEDELGSASASCNLPDRTIPKGPTSSYASSKVAPRRTTRTTTTW